MARMLGSTLLGGLLGFLAMLVAFFAFWHHRGPDEGIIFVFSLMGALPAAVLGALFAGVSLVLRELRETRREMKHWQSTFQFMMSQADDPSTEFRSGPPRK